MRWPPSWLLFVSAMNRRSCRSGAGIPAHRDPLGLALVVAFVAGLVAGLIWRVYWVAELLNERGRLRRALRLAEQKARAAGGKCRLIRRRYC